MACIGSKLMKTEFKQVSFFLSLNYKPSSVVTGSFQANSVWIKILNNFSVRMTEWQLKRGLGKSLGTARPTKPENWGQSRREC